MSRKAIFIDIDGTLYNSKKEVTPRTIKALKQVQKYDYTPVLCTGNPYRYSARLSQMFDGKYIIANTGAAIYNCQTQTVLYQKPLAEPDIQKLHQIIHDSNSEYVFSLDGEYVKITANLSWQELWNQIKNHIVTQIVLRSYDYNYMLQIHDQIKSIPSLQIPNQSKYLTRKTPGPEQTRYFCDILGDNTNKGSGIKRFCQLLQISPIDTIGIGDDLNDLKMFAACNYNVAMGNALEQVKVAADYITLDNDHEGLAVFIEQKLLS